MQDKFSGREPKYYDIFTGLFVAVLLISEITSTKIVSFGFIQTAGAAVLFPISYIFSDILTEVYGYARARRVLWIGFAAVILQAIVLMVVQYLPSSPSWHNQQAYAVILGFVPRISVASVLAYWAGGFANDLVLAKMKLLTKGRYLWTRTIGSTIVGQAVDTFLFIGIAFYGILPTPVILQIIFSFYLFKASYEVVATPITYAVVSKLKKAEGLDVFDYHTNFSPFHFRVKDGVSGGVSETA
jgi:queuosine precursor transporter